MTDTPWLMGRRRIYTDRTTEELESVDVVKEELDRVFDIHWGNVRSIRFLKDYYLGKHPAILERQKKIRPDVDNKIVVDYAFSFTRDITGYFLGKSVRYVQRNSHMDDTDATGRDMSGTDPTSGITSDDEATQRTVTDGQDAPDETKPTGGNDMLPCPMDDCPEDKLRGAVEQLNHIFDIENKGQVDWDVATDMSVCGVGYKGVFVEENPRNGTHLSLSHLDPETTFVVYSAGNVKVPMYAVSYWRNNVKYVSDVKTFVTVYTQTKQYTFVVHGDVPMFGSLVSDNGLELMSVEDIDFGGGLPIIEYRNNRHGLGDWEVAIPLMDGIDTLASDGVNDVEQFVANVLVAIGMEFDEDTQATLNNVGVLNIPQLPPGMEFAPELRYITPQLDATGASSTREYLESCLRVIVGVPDRKTRGGGGGDTGDAVFMRDGWQDIDLVAANKECWFVQSEREALNVVLYLLNSFHELSDVSVNDIEIKFNRNKTSNVQSKAQVLQTLWNILDPIDALDISDLTTNVQDVIIRAEKYQEKRLQRQLNEQQRVSEVAAQFKDEDPNDAAGVEKPNTGTPAKDENKTKNNKDK